MLLCASTHAVVRNNRTATPQQPLAVAGCVRRVVKTAVHHRPELGTAACAGILCRRSEESM